MPCAQAAAYTVTCRIAALPDGAARSCRCRSSEHVCCHRFSCRLRLSSSGRMCIGRRLAIRCAIQQRAWAEGVELQVYDEWSAAAFEVSCVAIVVVRRVLAAVVDYYRRLIVGEAWMVGIKGRSLCERSKDSSWTHVCCKQSKVALERSLYLQNVLLKSKEHTRVSL